MASTIFEQPNVRTSWKTWGQRLASFPAERVRQMVNRADLRKMVASIRLGKSEFDASPNVPGLSVFHLYLRNGDVEYICKSCLEVVCRVRRAEDALIHQQTHTCETHQRTVDVTHQVI